MAIKVNGKSIQTDDEGYLIDPIDWNEEVAKQLAAADFPPISRDCLITTIDITLGSVIRDSQHS